MTPDPARKSPVDVGLLLSGGIDSSVLLAELLDRGEQVQPFYIRSGLAWQGPELSHLAELLAHLSGPRLAPLIVFDVPLADLYGRHWSLDGRDVPAAGTADDAVYLPGRNLLLLLKPALWCQMHGVGRLALGLLAGNPFGDATEGFFAAVAKALCIAGPRGLLLERPLAGVDKAEVLRRGRHLPLERTFSCIAPVGGLHCGHCNKCGERQAAFRRATLTDPTTYA